jgi:GTPase SAR1 family protein
MVSPADARPEAAPPPSESEPSRPDLASDAAAAASASATAASASMDDRPTVAIVIGMAGSGKTSLMQRVNAYKHAQGKPPYIINLDPAVTQTPYDANVDIRDTVDYKNVMKEYNLGPNGGILTASNLFATRFDQVVSLCEKRSAEIDNVFVDTPGQIEIFTWSASGAIVTESFASAFPTVVLYVVDTPRALNPQSFMSNMLQAVSILYKTRLPLIVVFNKIDVARHETLLRWMEDFEQFHAAVDENPTFASDLSRSLSLVLDAFYKGLRCAGVSAMTGEGMEELFDVIARARKEYMDEYLPELRARRAKRDGETEAKRAEEAEKVKRDLAADSRGEALVMDGSNVTPESFVGEEDTV